MKEWALACLDFMDKDEKLFIETQFLGHSEPTLQRWPIVMFKLMFFLTETYSVSTSWDLSATSYNTCRWLMHKLSNLMCVDLQVLQKWLKMNLLATRMPNWVILNIWGYKRGGAQSERCLALACEGPSKINLWKHYQLWTHAQKMWGKQKHPSPTHSTCCNMPLTLCSSSRPNFGKPHNCSSEESRCSTHVVYNQNTLPIAPINQIHLFSFIQSDVQSKLPVNTLIVQSEGWNIADTLWVKYHVKIYRLEASSQIHSCKYQQQSENKDAN